MKYLALQLPGGNAITTNIVPTGGPGTLNSIVTTGLNLAILAAIFVCLFIFVLGGFEWIFSQGDKQKVAKARNRLTMATLGLIVVFTSFLIINVIYVFFFGHGIDFLASFG